jgi:hypothetical protein
LQPNSKCILFTANFFLYSAHLPAIGVNILDATTLFKANRATVGTVVWNQPENYYNIPQNIIKIRPLAARYDILADG